MTKEQKVVALVRRHLSALEVCSVADSDAAMQNLSKVQDAAESFGLGDLAMAAIYQDQVKTKEGRAVLFASLSDPLGYLERANKLIDQYKEYL